MMSKLLPSDGTKYHTLHLNGAIHELLSGIVVDGLVINKSFSLDSIFPVQYSNREQVKVSFEGYYLSNAIKPGDIYKVGDIPVGVFTGEPDQDGYATIMTSGQLDNISVPTLLLEGGNRPVKRLYKHKDGIYSVSINIERVFNNTRYKSNYNEYGPIDVILDFLAGIPFQSDTDPNLTTFIEDAITLLRRERDGKN